MQNKKIFIQVPHKNGDLHYINVDHIISVQRVEVFGNADNYTQINLSHLKSFTTPVPAIEVIEKIYKQQDG